LKCSKSPFSPCSKSTTDKDLSYIIHNVDASLFKMRLAAAVKIFNLKT
jgi:hypothetical protein